jgi:urea carboxylase-associated protein 2
MTPPIDSNLIVYQHRLQIADSWSFIVRRGHTLRVSDSEGGANCSLLAYNNEEKLERYNMADTLKAQHTAMLTRGNVLYSDMGRILFSITADTCGWHDTIGGVSDARLVHEKYGDKPYQGNLNDFYRNGHELFLIELGKYGLGKRDLVANINLFSKVVVDDLGSMHFESGNSKAGDYVDLRAEMNTLVILNNCQHPLDPAPQYQPRVIELALWKSGNVPHDDLCRNHCPENQRGFVNTENYFCQYAA